MWVNPEYLIKFVFLVSVDSTWALNTGCIFATSSFNRHKRTHWQMLTWRFCEFSLRRSGPIWNGPQSLGCFMWLTLIFVKSFDVCVQISFQCKFMEITIWNCFIETSFGEEFPFIFYFYLNLIQKNHFWGYFLTNKLRLYWRQKRKKFY